MFDHEAVGWLTGVLLLSVRLSFAFGLSPLMTTYRVPVVARLVVVLVLACLCTPENARFSRYIEDPIQLLPAIGAEGLVGMLLGASVHVGLASFAIAGRLLDVQIGIGLGSVFDPLTQSSVSAISSALNALGVCAFVLTGAHFEYLAMLAESINHFPVGSLPELADPVGAMGSAGHMFRFGLSLAAPVVVALLLTDVAVGVISRNAPQLNALLLAIPIKLVIGLSILAMALPWWETAIEPVLRFGTDLLGATR